MSMKPTSKWHIEAYQRFSGGSSIGAYGGIM